MPINHDLIVNVPQYRKSKVEHDFIDEEVKKMLDADLIEISDSPFQSPDLVKLERTEFKRKDFVWTSDD